MRPAIALCAVLFAISADAAPRREALVQWAHKSFPILLKVVKDSPAFANMPKFDREIFEKVEGVASPESNPLNFSDDPALFNLVPDQATRLMSTAIGAAGPINVNAGKLNSVETMDLPLIVKFLFHEYGHKAGFEMADRDRVAQFFENQVRGFNKPAFELSDGAKIILLSVPLDAVDEPLVDVPNHRPLPTFGLFVERDGEIADLTETLTVGLRQPTSVMRSWWAEVNQLLYSLIPQVFGAFEQQAAQLRRQAGQNDAMVEGAIAAMEKELNRLVQKVDEIRIVDLKDLTFVDLTDSWLINLKSIYSISRTKRRHFHFNTKGFEWSDSYPVPMNIQIILPKSALSGAPVVRAILRPNADYSSIARVGTINRSQDGLVQRLRVRPSKLDPAEKVHLLMHFPGGQYSLPHKKLEETGNGQWTAEFEIPWNYYGIKPWIIADSVLIGPDRTVPLDRLIELTDSDSRAKAGPPPVRNHIVPGSLGIWGTLEDDNVFFTNLSWKQGAYFMDGMRAEKPVIEPSNIVLEFKMEREEKVREIRLQYKRFQAIVKLDKPEFNMAERGGKVLRMVASNGHGSIVAKKETHETAIVTGGHVYLSETFDGKQKVKAKFTAPFRHQRDLQDPLEAYHPDFFMPIGVEIVTASGQTLYHSWGEQTGGADGCGDILK